MAVAAGRSGHLDSARIPLLHPHPTLAPATVSAIHICDMQRSASRLAAIVVATFIGAEGHADTLGSILFTDTRSKQLFRLDPSGAPQVVARNITTYGGLLSWKEKTLAATLDHKIIQVDPWCNNSCISSNLVDVPKAIGVETVADVFSIGGITLCGNDAMFVAYGGNATTGHSGVLRCEACEPGGDCTPNCSVVDGGDSPGTGMRQLGGFPAGIQCVGDHVLVVDNNNARVQALDASCLEAPCNVTTFASELDYPLGITVTREDEILVSLDSSIVSLAMDGSAHPWSPEGDCGYLVEAGHSLLVAHGDIISFDVTCRGPSCMPSIVWNSTGSIKVYGSLAVLVQG